MNPLFPSLPFFLFSLSSFPFLFSPSIFLYIPFPLPFPFSSLVSFLFSFFFLLCGAKDCTLISSMQDRSFSMSYILRHRPRFKSRPYSTVSSTLFHCRIGTITICLWVIVESDNRDILGQSRAVQASSSPLSEL